MKKWSRKVRKAVKAEMPKYYRHLDMEMARRRQVEQIVNDLKEQEHDMAKTINILQDEKRMALEKIDELVANALEIAKQRDSATDKALSYIESAKMFKGENEDLRARCKEVEEMLRQTESKLEVANKLLIESEADLKTEVELKKMFFDASNAGVKRIEELEADNKRLHIELQEHINKPWYKKLFG